MLRVLFPLLDVAIFIGVQLYSFFRCSPLYCLRLLYCSTYFIDNMQKRSIQDHAVMGLANKAYHSTNWLMKWIKMFDTQNLDSSPRSNTYTARWLQQLRSLLGQPGGQAVNHLRYRTPTRGWWMLSYDNWY